MDIYQKALVELSTIESEIAEKIRRRDTLRQFISMGQSLFKDSKNLFDQPVSAVIVTASPHDHLRTKMIRNTLSSRVGVAVEAILNAQGPTATKDLLPMLEAQGIEIGGENRIATLSVILSRNNKFIADRTTGWKLRSEENELPGFEKKLVTKRLVFPSYSADSLPQQLKSVEGATNSESNSDDEK